MGSLSVWHWFLVLVVFPALLALYFLPLIAGRKRRIPLLGLLFLTNLIFGWTLVGWLACMLWAVLATPAARESASRGGREIDREGKGGTA